MDEKQVTVSISRLVKFLDQATDQVKKARKESEVVKKALAKTGKQSLLRRLVKAATSLSVGSEGS